MKQLPKPTYIDRLAQLDDLRRTLDGVHSLAIDTESNSLFAYQEQVCLIQLTAAGRDFILDPLAVDCNQHCDFLAEMLADPHIEVIMHAGEYDVMCLRRDFGWTIGGLFDTMVGARIIGWEHIGLATILADLYDVDVDKRYQTANWGKRPLSSDMIHYAQLDTHYLPQLRDALHEQIVEGGHLEESRELFDEVCEAVWNGPSPTDFWSVSRSHYLDPRGAAILRELYLWREEEAQAADKPVFKIAGDKRLLKLARAKPTTLEGVEKHLSYNQARRYGYEVLDAIDRGREAPPQHPPEKPDKPSDAVLARYDMLHTWRKERARARGVSSEIIMPKDALWEMAHEVPRSFDTLERIESMGPWRRKTYGPELLQLIASHERKYG